MSEPTFADDVQDTLAHQLAWQALRAWVEKGVPSPGGGLLLARMDATLEAARREIAKKRDEFAAELTP